MNRKTFICKIAAVLLIVFAAQSCAKDDSKTLHLYNWTYYTPDSILEKFEEETGIKVIVDNFSSNEEMFAKLQAGGGNGYDIIVPSADYTSIMIKENLVQQLDKTLLPNLENISPLVHEKATYDPDMDYSVPYFMGSSGIAVNKKKLEENGIGYDKSWMIFADESLSGKMSMLDDMREVMGAALKKLGYSINTADEGQLDEAARLIEEQWKPNLVKFDAESFAKSFGRGEFWVVHCYPEAVFEEVGENNWDNIDFFIPEEGGCMYIDNMVIPKGAKNVEGAHAFINFFHRPDIHALFLDEFNFPATTNPKAAEYTTTEPFFQPEELDSCELIMDIGADLEKYNTRWQKIRYTK